jgi:arylsulfatase A-like enzyme
MWLGRTSHETEQPVANTTTAPAVLVTLMIAVCTTIFGIKFAVALNGLWSKGSGITPFVVFNWELPLPIAILSGIWKTWLCCAEDFTVGLAIVLVAALVFRLISLRYFTERLPKVQLACRWTFWILAYTCAIFAVGLMIADMFYFFKMDRWLTKKSFDMAGNIFSMEKSVQDEMTLSRKLLLIMLPLAMVATQLGLVHAFPRFWRWVAHHLRRPVSICAGAAGFIAFAVLTMWAQTPGYAFPMNWGGFMHNPHAALTVTYMPDSVQAAYTLPDKFPKLIQGEWQAFFRGGWDIDNVAITKDEDFLPGMPGTGDLKLDKEKRPKNIIFIVIESGGSQWTHLYGGPWANTPNLEKIILEDKHGIVCDNTYAISDHTIASAIALFGSMNNHECDNCAVYDARNWPGPNKNFPVPSASTWLQKKGYRTYFCGAGGKDVWQGYKNLGEAFLPYGFDIAKDGFRHWGKEKPDWGFKEDNHNDVSLFADAYRCLDDAKKKDKPFFLMMWNYDTHWKYTDGDGPKEEFDESKFPPMVQKDPERIAQFRRYLKSYWRFDRLVAKLYKDLDERGIADDTLIVITGDHGQSFGHHGIWTHGYKLYEEEVRVPLIFINKNLGEYAADNKCGPRNPILTSHIDIWPTIMDVCNIECNKKWQGRSIFTTKLDPDKRHDYLWVGGLAAIRQGDYKFIWDKEDHEVYLFDIKDDPGEQNNLLKQNPEKFNPLKDELQSQLHKWMGWQTKYNKDMLENGKRD